MTKTDFPRKCIVCGRNFGAHTVVQSDLVRSEIAELIAKEHENWSKESFVCYSDLAKYRAKYVHSILESEKGELSDLEKEVLQSMTKHELIAEDVDLEFEQDWTFGERLADKIASFGGSWRFLIFFALFLTAWVVANSLVLFWRPADPYPFILLNLILSCLASIQAPIIMMSQNRQEAKDRIRAQHDYKVNLKAELEIRHLHEKLDHLLSKQWERLAQIQEIQLELLSEIRPRK